jgi:acyl carrier protein
MEQMVDTEEIKSKIRSYVQESAFTNPDKIYDTTLIFKEGILDSMGLITLITYLEETFHFQIKETDLEEENFESIQAMANFVVNRL